MIKPNAISIVIVAAVLTASIACYLAYQFLTSRESRQRQGVTVIIAAKDIPVGAKLEAATIKQAVWPKENLPQQGYFTDSKVLTGRTAVRQISAGDIIAEQKLMPLNRADMGGVMTYIVPKGNRAVTVAVNEVAGVAGFITPGSRVDVVLTQQLPVMTINTPYSLEDQISRIILQNVPVLATGQVTEQKEGKPVIVPTVTLDLLPSDAEKIIVSAKKGSLQLLLRNIIDTAAVTTPGMTVTNVLDGLHDADAKKRVEVPRGRTSSARRAPPPPPKVIMEVVQVSATEKESSHTVYKLR